MNRDPLHYCSAYTSVLPFPVDRESANDHARYCVDLILTHLRKALPSSQILGSERPIADRVVCHQITVVVDKRGFSKQFFLIVLDFFRVQKSIEVTVSAVKRLNCNGIRSERFKPELEGVSLRGVFE